MHADSKCMLATGGELKHPDEMTLDMYLKKWLIAREWDVPLTYSCIISHAAWRAHTMPNGYIDEVSALVCALY